MRLSGSSILITGAASGIGRAAVLEFIKEGANVTALDLADEGIESLRAEVDRPAQLLCVSCDVSRDDQQADAFRQHVERWGGLDIAIINAGIGESGDVFGGDSLLEWQRTLDVDLRAALVGVHLAAREMRRGGRRGVIISVASAAGVFAHPDAPIYSAAKGGLVHFTRSAAPRAAAAGLRLCTVCPQFVDTRLVAGLPLEMRGRIAAQFGRLMEPAAVVHELLRLIRDDSKNGVAAVMLQDGKRFEWNPSLPGAKRGSGRGSAPPRSSPPAQLAELARQPLPQQFRAWQVVRLTSSFREATQLASCSMPDSPGADQVLVRRLFAGINASDVNYTSGKYHSSRAAAERALPFAAGFESVGIVVRAGKDAGMAPGTPVATFFTYGGFSEFTLERARHLIPVPAPTPTAIAMLTSGLTASVALAEVGRMAAGETVLVTAAAGGTGTFAVQLAKLAGCTVIGTCSSAAKAHLLRDLGVDRVVNYRTESLKQVLKAEFPGGVDVVYESVGGDMFDVAVDALASKGRLIVIGMMSQYGEGWPVRNHPGLPEKLLKRSASIAGFFLPQYAKHFNAHLSTLFSLHSAGKLRVLTDPTPFVGIESVPAAVEYLQSGASSGKVVVQLVPDLPPELCGRDAPHSRL